MIIDFKSCMNIGLYLTDDKRSSIIITLFVVFYMGDDKLTKIVYTKLDILGILHL